MDNIEAHRIFRCWQEYLETGDRFNALMMTAPPSFLPYPPDMLEQALNIVAKEIWDSGDRTTATEIQRLMAYIPDVSDEEALVAMHRHLSMVLGDDSLKKTLLEKLRASQQSWMDMRRSK